MVYIMQIKLPVHLVMGRVGLCSRPPQCVCVQEVLEREVHFTCRTGTKLSR